MNLEKRHIFSPDLPGETMPVDALDFSILVSATIGEKDKVGTEVFYFTAASPSALQNEIRNGEFKLLRGYILLKEFDWNTIRSAIQNIVNHSRHLENWNDVVQNFRLYALSDYD